jgi:hypothetical protein
VCTGHCSNADRVLNTVHSIPWTGIYDSGVDMHIGFAFPASTTGSEFIMEWVVPVSEKVRDDGW